MKTLSMVVLLGVVACTGPAGPAGKAGDPGAPGVEGANGANGEGGANADGGASRDGGAGPADAAPTTGTRLRPQYTKTVTTTSDGARQESTYQSGWFDMQRNEPCTFAAASDGTTRCLPTVLAIGDVSSGSYYSDAACTQQIALALKVSTCGTPQVTPKYFSAYGVNAGCAGYSLRSIGTLITPAGTYVKSGANCVAIPIQSSYDYYTPGGPEIAPTDFVEVTTTTTLL